MGNFYSVYCQLCSEANVSITKAAMEMEIKNKRHHANNVARCLFGALEWTRTPDLLIRSQNFLVIFNENALNCYSIVAL